jgi:multiple sugar transport system ATP-binding protein
MIYVTHDQVEAMTMGDRICVMRDGLIMQIADPLTLYRHPENMFAAGFIGSPPMNLLKGTVKRRDGGLLFVQIADTDGLQLPLKGRLEPLAGKYVDKEVVFGIRPEHITSESIDGLSAAATLTVETSEPMGSESLVYLKTGAGQLDRAVRVRVECHRITDGLVIHEELNRPRGGWVRAGFVVGNDRPQRQDR